MASAKGKKKAIKKTAKKTTPKKNSLTLEQLQSTAKDLNNFMNDINEGEYKNPIDADKNDIGYLSEEIIGMVKKEMFKQDKDSLTTDSVAIVEKLGINFETLRDDPDQIQEPVKVESVKKVKKESGKEAIKKSRYGSRPETQAAILDDLIFNKKTRSQIIEYLEDNFDMNSGKAGSRLQTHINHLRTKKNLTVTKLKNESYEVK
jgi:hypothetical protein